MLDPPTHNRPLSVPISVTKWVWMASLLSFVYLLCHIYLKDSIPQINKYSLSRNNTLSKLRLWPNKSKIFQNLYCFGRDFKKCHASFGTWIWYKWENNFKIFRESASFWLSYDTNNKLWKKLWFENEIHKSCKKHLNCGHFVAHNLIQDLVKST